MGVCMYIGKYNKKNWKRIVDESIQLYKPTHSSVCQFPEQMLHTLAYI